MAKSKLPLVLLASVALLAAGCDSRSSLWPTLTGDSAAAGSIGLPTLGTTNFQPLGVSDGPDTGTYVNDQIQDMRDRLADIQDRIRDDNATLQDIRQTVTTTTRQYYEQVAAIQSRLQVGTTPGNPQVVQAWREAQMALEEMNTQIGAMNALLADVAENDSQASYLVQAVRSTYGVSGAVEEDHFQLNILMDEARATAGLVNRMRAELTQDIQRQTAYVGKERAQLTALSSAIAAGSFVGGGGLVSMGPGPLPGGGMGMGMPMGNMGSGMAMGRPLVTIDFSQPGVDYRGALQGAVSQALARKPNATFQVMGSAANSNQARRNAETVMNAMVQMGVPAQAVSLSSSSSATTGGQTVQVFVR